MGSRPGRSRSGCGRAERSSGGPRRRPGRSAAVVVAVALAAALALVAAPGASAREPQAPVVGPTPGPARLTDATARQAALARAREFRDRSPLIDRITLRRCERDGFRRVTCTFLGRGSVKRDGATKAGVGVKAGAAACRLTVEVRGTDRHHRTTLHASCRANPGHHLSFHEASAAIRAAAERLARHPVVIVVAERLNGLRVAAGVEWWNGTANCEARFVARLTSAAGITVTHRPPDCGGSGRLAGAAAGG
ncbi:MAG: hypothetical protein JSS68_05315 [Actinobacteria bacterium]|nr:hypothetical protein [Actinomycetota bacterium]